MSLIGRTRCHNSSSLVSLSVVLSQRLVGSADDDYTQQGTRRQVLAQLRRCIYLPCVPRAMNVVKQTPRVEYAAWFSILCTMAGTGILQLPLTLKQGGWLCLALIVVIAAMTNTTGKWLIHCLYEHSSDGSGQELLLQPGRRLKDYPSIGEAAYGTFGKILVQVFHKLTLVGVTTIFLDSRGKVPDGRYRWQWRGLCTRPWEPSGCQNTWQTRWTLISAALVAVPVVLIPNMGEIAPLAAFGLFCTFACVIEIVVFAIVFQPIKMETAHRYNLPVPPQFQFHSFWR